MPVKTVFINGMKNCSACKVDKPISKFYYIDRGRPDKYSSRCKECLCQQAKDNVEKIKVPCPSCGEKISRKGKTCRSCYHKSPEGLNHHKKISEKNKSKKTYHFCLDCNVRISRQSTRCMKCKAKGELNPKWNGGVSSLNKLIRSSFEYRQWRSDVFTRDDFTCNHCLERGCTLHAHHIVEMAKILQKHEITTVKQSIKCSELWDINNGQTLCVSCHTKAHK